MISLLFLLPLMIFQIHKFNLMGNTTAKMINQLKQYRKEFEDFMKKDEVILIATLPIALQTLLHTIITLVGFTSSGVGARTLAAFIQSVFYAGTITSGGIFAILQHLGATGVLFPNIISIIYTLIMLCIFLYRKIEKEENKQKLTRLIQIYDKIFKYLEKIISKYLIPKPQL